MEAGDGAIVIASEQSESSKFLCMEVPHVSQYQCDPSTNAVFYDESSDSKTCFESFFVFEIMIPETSSKYAGHIAARQTPLKVSEITIKYSASSECWQATQLPSSEVYELVVAKVNKRKCLNGNCIFLADHSPDD